MIDQLDMGIIPVLVDKFSWLVGAPSVFSWKHASERKRKYWFDDAVLQKKNLPVKIVKDDVCFLNFLR